MLKKIYQELVLIRKELQAMNGSKEFCVNIDIDGKKVAKAVAKVEGERRVSEEDKGLSVSDILEHDLAILNKMIENAPSTPCN
ncbi:MAG: hypothetical protein QM793_15040 [Muricomes sp.]